MLQQENLAANFCGLLKQNYNYKKSAYEWRILGQEQDGSMLSSWISETEDGECSNIGIYSPIDKSFRILFEFPNRVNCIQATVNASRTLLSFTLKESKSTAENGESFLYFPFIVEVKDERCEPEHLLPNGSKRQVMTQFLWQKKNAFEKSFEDKLLFLVHDDTVSVLKVKLRRNADFESIDLHDDKSWRLDRTMILREVIIKHFVWAQFDPVVQALYYIHLKPTAKSSLEKQEDSMTTTLSAAQFHENLPRETVVSLNKQHISK